MITVPRNLKPVGFWKTAGRAEVEPDIDPTSGLADVVVAFLRRAFQTISEKDLPNVFDHVDPNWDSDEQKRVLAHVENRGFKKTSYMGFSRCRFCGKQNGVADFADKKFIWPEGLGHYIREHQVRPPKDFVDHVLGRKRRR